MLQPMSNPDPIRLTQYSHGAGCGCKIAPNTLERILSSKLAAPAWPRLLVGNDSRDDAAVYDLGDGTGLVCTTDFFSPIVDDAADFGRIAAVNALSDVYAMGGEPLLALAILGWPLDKLSPELAQQVLDGARGACMEAGIPLAGGHSIDTPEPVFGLAVTGRVELPFLKRNGGAMPGDLLFLSKPLGVGVLSTAQKRGILQAAHYPIALELMGRLNKAGAPLARVAGLHAMTDVTGFGLLGHLLEMCDASGCSARIFYDRLPLIPEALEYARQNCLPDAAHRNFQSYGARVTQPASLEQYALLSDPQTSGGLLFAVAPAQAPAFLQAAEAEGLDMQAFGEMIPRQEPCVVIG